MTVNIFDNVFQLYVQTLTHLYLDGNEIKDEGARHLAALLTQNQVSYHSVDEFQCVDEHHELQNIFS